jgi:bifunctional N-acetylglucosamine-1-phosphate-uridyltransferase/glucosamine-1-phosphate-acetyltransferase GlmU-like protein
MSGKVRKAVLPVAGLGTRVLPGAKVTPKEMLNVVDRPILSYIIEEGRAAGIEHFVFVTGRGKGAIEDNFDHHVELEAQLEAKGKLDILADIRRDLPKPGEMSFVRQMAQGKQPVILRSIMALAADLGMDVVAEGVESESDAIELYQIGAQYAQGFAFGEAMSGEEARRLVGAVEKAA